MLNTSLSDANKYPLKLNDLIAFSLNVDKAPQSVTWTNQKQVVTKTYLVLILVEIVYIVHYVKTSGCLMRPQ